MRRLLRWCLWLKIQSHWFWIKRVEQRLATDALERAFMWRRIHLLQLEAELLERRRS